MIIGRHHFHEILGGLDFVLVDAFYK